MKTIIDMIWNLKLFKGRRTQIAQAVIVGLSVYQYLATLPSLIQLGLDLPDLSVATYTALIAYFGLQVKKFAVEHEA